MISCILGSKDRDKKIKNLLTSLYKNYKSINCEPDIIIIDGGSNDSLINYLQSCQGVTLLREGGLHGVTRAYNRGFRLAKYKYLTWLSDDLVLDDNLFELAVNNLLQLGDFDILSMSMNNNDGAGWHVYKDITPVGFCTKKLMTNIDYWSEDYITYASDLDFCIKALSLGGIIKKNPNLKMYHFMDHKDELHEENVSGNTDTLRYRNAWKIPNDSTPYTLSNRIYPNIFLNVKDKDELISRVQEIWDNISWANIYVDNLFGLYYLQSMNVFEVNSGVNFHIKL